MVMVAATLGEADRLWKDWRTFHGREPPTRFIPRAAHDEYSALVEGIGSGRTGVLEEIISDAAMAILLARPAEPSGANLSAIGLAGARLDRIKRLIPVLAGIFGGGWDSGKALDALRSYERDFARRKRDFLARHFVFTPADEVMCRLISSNIEALIPSGGASWHNDAEILAQAAMHKVESDQATAFVTEDQRHMSKPRSKEIIRITGLSGIRDLRGNPL